MSTSTFAPLDLPPRLGRLRDALDSEGVDALIVTDLTNIRYLTGFTGSNGLLWVADDRAILVTDGRYTEQAASQLDEAGVTVDLVIAPDGGAALRDAIADDPAKRVGLEADSITWAAATRHRDDLLSTRDVVPTTGLVSALRVVKDDGEIDRIAAAAAIADAAFAEVRGLLDQRPTEVAFALELDTAMRRLGADDISFDTIVASGPNGARPHHRPGSRRLGEGDLVVLDFGALVDGYHSDMTRTVQIGEPSATQQRMYEVVKEAQAAGVAAVRDGIAARDVDAACRGIIAEAGWADAFSHGTGHGVGLDIHEDPRVAATSAATLVDRCVVTVEPGVYLPEHGGVRIEDTVVVTPDGARPVTLTHKHAAVDPATENP